MKKLYFVFGALLLAMTSNAQLSIPTTDVPVFIDFTGFSGAGFQPGGGGGTLNSDDWSATGFSEGDLDFGATMITGDFARGTTMGLVNTGGVYGVDIAGNQGLMVQPVADDFTPGSFILKIQNNTGVEVADGAAQCVVRGVGAERGLEHTARTAVPAFEPGGIDRSASVVVGEIAGRER